MDASFDADAVFGTHVCTCESDDWLNVYANYDMEANCVCDTLDVYLGRRDGTEQDFKYRLNDEERAMLLPKMEMHCQNCMGKSLAECREEYMAEQPETQPPNLTM